MTVLNPMYKAVPNSPRTYLNGAIGDTDTTINLVDASVLPEAPNLCTLGIGETAETIYYGKINGNTLENVVRGYDNTTATAWTDGSPVARYYTSADHNTFISNINKLAHSDIYGVAIDETELHPSTRVTYTDDAVGLIPMSGGDGNFSYGGWKRIFDDMGIRPCIVNPNGTVAVYLDPDDYTKDVNGNVVDITGSGETGNGENVCIEIPTIWYKMWKDGTTQYMQFSRAEFPGALALAHTRDPLFGTVAEGEVSSSAVVRDKIYVSAYSGWTDGNSKQRSLSGKTPTGSINHPTAQTRCRANGSGWEMTTFHVRNLMSILFTVFFKSTNSQAALGAGATNTTLKNTGTRNTSGMFYGSTSTEEVLKFCGIEAPFDNIGDWVDGLYSTIGTNPPDLGARKLCIATTDFDTVAYTGTSAPLADVNPTPDNWKVCGTGFASDLKWWLKTIHGGIETGIITTEVDVEEGGPTTHYCDTSFLEAGRLAYAGGDYGDGTTSGAFFMLMVASATSWGEHLGARAMFIEEIS